MSKPASRHQQEGPAVTESRIVGKQVVFRVRDPRATARSAPRKPKTSAPDGLTKERVHHARKTHQKSRTGCGNCKRRRVKCDERKSGCQKCEAYGIKCNYTSQSPPSNCSVVARRDDLNVGSNITFRTLSAADLTTKINDALLMGETIQDGRAAPLVSPNSPAIVALRQFFSGTAEMGYMPDIHWKTMTTDVMRLALKTPFLMHAILGTAVTSMGLAFNDRSLKTTEAFHWQKAITMYQQELLAPVGPHNMDQLMSTCIFMSVLSFSELEYDPRESWVFSSDPRALNWLLVQGGLKYLIISASPWLKKSIWWEAFMESEDSQGTYHNDQPGPEGLPAGLAELCGIDETTTVDNNPYHWPLRLLAPLLSLEMSRYNLTRLCSFMGRLEPEFVNLLHKKDEPAILILGYWLGKMCEDPVFWQYPRYHAECIAICMYLENSTDPRVLKLLEYPAEKCGYILAHVADSIIFAENNALVSTF